MVTIHTVEGRSDLKKFIAFPNKLFKGVPTYIPALNSDERKLLTDKNPSLEHCSRELYLAVRDGKVVGRVAAIINRSVNEHWQKKAVRFGWFDFIEDYEVFKALLDKVVEYGRKNGMTEIEGPFGFTDMDKECWAIDHFDARQNISTLYNPEYYIKFIERAGYEIKCKWQQYVMPANQPVPDKVARLNTLIMEKYHLRLVKVKRRKDIMPYAWKFFHTLNDCFKDLYDFVPMTEKEIGVYIKEYFPFINLDFVQFVVDQDDNLVGFGLSVPDLTQAYQKANGSLFPFGWYHILHALKHFDTIDLLLNGVHPDWQKRGVHSIYYSDMNENAIKFNVHTAYTNPQIIGNEAVKIWETQYHTTPLMQRAVFGKSL
jgi:GNAT superfamily N-acetyltransferase